MAQNAMAAEAKQIGEQMQQQGVSPQAMAQEQPGTLPQPTTPGATGTDGQWGRAARQNDPAMAYGPPPPAANQDQQPNRAMER